MYRPILIARYLWRRRITHFAVVAVALCVFTVVVVMTVMTGLVGDFKEKNHAFTGDCVVATESLVGFPYYEEFMSLVEQTGLTAGVSPVVKSYALLGLEGGSEDDVEIVGLDPVRHSQATNFGHDAELPQERRGEGLRADVRSEPPRLRSRGSTGRCGGTRGASTRSSADRSCTP